MTDELLNTLRYKSEGTDIDFKQTQYRFIGASDEEKSELLKDILAIANAWREGTGYILLGFKDRRPHPAEIVGITDHIDDAQLQQFVNGKVKPKLTFRYEELFYEGKTVGVISIPKQKRPFHLSSPYGKLKKNIVYVRRGSSTDEAEPTEVSEMGASQTGRGEVKVELSVLTPLNAPLPDTIPLAYLSFTEKFPDYQSPGSLYGINISATLQRDNSNFWRQYAKYLQTQKALIQLKLVLKNCSGIPLSKAKIEITLEALSGQEVKMLAGNDLPGEPKAQWNPMHGLRSLPENMVRQDPKLIVDEDGLEPICHVRFGDLLPGEEGRSSDTLAVIPRGSGKLRLHFLIRAAELSEPIKSEQVLDAVGEVRSLDFDGFKDYVRTRLGL